jgi:hypothetical protein
VNGFSTSSFHDQCHGHGNTIAIIETTKHFILGGFSLSVWHSNGACIPDASGQSFLFSLTNPHNQDSMSFPLSNKSYALFGLSNYGPIVGEGRDIYVESSRNSTSLGGSYVNETWINGNQVFPGESNFTLEEIVGFSIDL